MSTQSLQLLAVGFSARWLQESAFRGGLSSHAVDFFADVDTGEFGPVTKVSSWREVASVAAALRPEAILIGGGFESQPDLVESLRGIAPLLNTSAKSCRLSRDPSHWGPALRDAGLLVPRMVTGNASRAIEAGPGQGRWLVKNPYSAGGNRVREWTQAAADRESGCGLAPSEYLQEMIFGEPCSLMFWLQPGEHYCLGYFQQLCGDARLSSSRFQFAGAIGPLPYDREEAELFQRVADTLVGQLGLSGLVGVDLLRAAAGWYAVEINPRPTATAELWERAYSNQSLVGKLWESWTGRATEWPTATSTSREIQGKAIFYWRDSRPLVVDKILAAKLRQAWLDGWLSDVPASGTSFELGDPVATVFASGANALVVREELESRLVALRKELAVDGESTAKHYV